MIRCKLAVPKILDELRHRRSNARVKTNHGGRTIEIGRNIEHKVLKTETKNMKISQLSLLANKEKHILLSKLQENLLHEEFMDDLILFDDPVNSPFEQKSTSLDFEFFNRLNKLECFDRKRGSWYTEEQLQELSKLLDQYPERKKMIRSALKIPQSSFCKLLKEIKTQRNFLKIPK